jgi:secreted trypsin-like serine protease
MKTNLQIVKLASLALTVSIFASCAPKAGPNNNASGLRVQNIVGGTDATADYQKANGIVGIVIVSEDGPGICTGTLIHKRLVLTAAHCIAMTRSPIQRIVVVFAPSLESAKKENLRYANTGEEHKDFMTSVISGEGSWNDIALLKLSEDAPADFKLAKLANALNDKNLKADAQAIQAGFGRAEADRDAITDTSGTLRKVENIALIKKSDDGKELQFKEDGKGSCNGDSGGPAFLKVGRKLVQVGINSRGTSRTTCLEVGIFTNIIPHLPWIKETAKKLLESDNMVKSEQPAPSAPAPPAPSAPAPPKAS